MCFRVNKSDNVREEFLQLCEYCIVWNPMPSPFPYYPLNVNIVQLFYLGESQIGFDYAFHSSHYKNPPNTLIKRTICTWRKTGNNSWTDSHVVSGYRVCLCDRSKNKPQDCSTHQHTSWFIQVVQPPPSQSGPRYSLCPHKVNLITASRHSLCALISFFVQRKLQKRTFSLGDKSSLIKHFYRTYKNT